MTNGALCVEHDPIYFHPLDDLAPGARGKDEKRYPFPKSICAKCPIRRECLISSKGAPGIWGGLDEKERGLVLGREWVAQRVTPYPPTPKEIVKVDAYLSTQPDITARVANSVLSSKHS